MRNKRFGIAGATLLATTLALSACGTTGGDGKSGEGSGGCAATIAFIGPLTGADANLGLNIVRGVKLAKEQYDAASPKCNVTVHEYDSQGNPDKATPLASQMVNDAKLIGVIGPTFSGETNATGATFAEAKLVTVSPSATRVDLSSNGWDTFHRLLGNDGLQGPALARYVKNTMKPKKVFAIDDASDYGKGLAEIVKKDLGDLVTASETVQQGQKDFKTVVTKVKASGTDLLFYGGYYSDAGTLVKQLRAGGYKGEFIAGDGVKDPGFLAAAGETAAEDAVLTCPCAPADTEFAAAYLKSSGEEVGTYSTEGYDAMTLYLKGIDAGNTDRAKMLDWVNAYEAEGKSGPIKFDDKGELVGGKVYAYVVDVGKISGGKVIE